MLSSRGEANLNTIFSEKEMPKRRKKERSDKLKDIKFPVTSDQRAILRRLAKQMIEDPKVRNETRAVTNTLLQAFNHYSIFPDRCHPIEYKDTGQYMHAKPPKIVHEKIFELSLSWNVSIRRAAHRLIMNYIHAGEVVIQFDTSEN